VRSFRVFHQNLLRLKIFVGPPKILSDKDVIIVNETDSIDLVCETFNALPMTNFSWLNDNANHYERVEIKDEVSDSFKYVLRINDVDESDSGSFECLLENSLGHDRIILELLVQTSPKIDSVVMKSSQVEGEVEDEITVIEDDKLKFECIVDGYPTPEVTWYKGQDEIESSSNDSSLVIEKAAEEHAGWYQCLAINVLGHVAKSFKMKVNFPPKRLESQNNVLKVVEGEGVSLICSLTSNPPPVISWSMNGRSLESDEKVNISADHRTLSFIPTITDSGVYSCQAENVLGKGNSDFTLVVLGLPKIIVAHDEQRNLKVGDDLELACDAAGFPQVTSDPF
jgi:Immunoglobulin domain/Immunoglobulin I-set domain